MNQNFDGSDLLPGCGNEPDCTPETMTPQQKCDQIMANLENTLGMFISLTRMLPPEGQTAVINQTVQVLRLAFPKVLIQMPTPAKAASRIILP